MREHGPKSVKSLWQYAKHLNDEHARKVGAVVYEAGADIIVFEHLDFRGKRWRGSKAQKLSQWRKNTIQEIASQHAHKPYLCTEHGLPCVWRQ